MSMYGRVPPRPNKREVSGSVRQQLTCEFYNLLWTHHGSAYSCKVRHHTLYKNSELEFIGTHQGLFSGRDVVGVSFENCSISQIPQGLTKVFPNLRYLELYNCELTQVTHDSLKEYVNLANLILPLNKIPFISSDMLENLRSLEVFSLNHTKVNLIEPNIFDKLPNLKHVDLTGTDYINKCFSTPESGLGNATLEEIKRDLLEKYSPWRKVIEKYKIEKHNNDSRLETELGKAQSVRLSLTQQVGSLTEKISQKDREIADNKRRLAEAEREISNMKVLKIQSQAECEGLRKKLAEVDSESSRKWQEMKARSDREVEELKRRVAAVEGENKMLNSGNVAGKLEANQLRQKVTEVGNENRALKDEKFKIKKEADALRQQVYDTVKEMNERLQIAKAQSDREIASYKQQIADFEKHSKSLDNENIARQLAADDLKWKVQQTQSENESLKQQAGQTQKEVDGLKQTIIAVSEEKTKALAEVGLLKQQLEQELRSSDREIGDLEQKLSWQMRLTEAAKVKELEEQRITIQTLNQKLQTLERENERLQQVSNQSSAQINSLKLKVIETADDMSYENIKLKHEAVIFGDFKTVMEDDGFKDFTIKTEFEEFKAHKFVLAARSPVFARVFKDNVHAECLNLLDISTKIFREILHFIYTDDFPQAQTIDCMELFKASERLKIEKLKKFAVRKLVDKIDSENAFEVLVMANKYGYDELRQRAFEEIKKFFDNEKIDDALATQPDKLKRLVEIKRMKNELMKELESEFTAVLKQN